MKNRFWVTFPVTYIPEPGEAVDTDSVASVIAWHLELDSLDVGTITVTEIPDDAPSIHTWTPPSQEVL